jgi:Putative membrane protein insertion efficiency factor
MPHGPKRAVSGVGAGSHLCALGLSATLIVHPAAAQERESAQASANTAVQAEWEEPFEAEDLEPAPIVEASHALGPITDLALIAIRYYQVEIGPNSISRCPYSVSCSVFAHEHIRREGLFGIPAFIDRAFYRENAATFLIYPRAIQPNGQIRYDDYAFRLP